MKTKAIYRTAIVSYYGEVIYISNVCYSNKKTAIEFVKKLKCKKEEEIKRNKNIEVYYTIHNHKNYCDFEKVRNDNNKRYYGIITETLIMD